MRELHEMQVRTYIAEPERGRRNWTDKQADQKEVYANRRRIQGERGKRLLAKRGERIERNFAHQFDTGGMDRLYVRGRGNAHKKLLLQAAACNLALLMRALHGAGKPRAAHDRLIEAVFKLLRLITALSSACQSQPVSSGVQSSERNNSGPLRRTDCLSRKWVV